MQRILRVHLGWLYGSWQHVPFPDEAFLPNMDMSDIVGTVLGSFCTRFKSRRTTLRFELSTHPCTETEATELLTFLNAFVAEAASHGIVPLAQVRPAWYLRYAFVGRGSVDPGYDHIRASSDPIYTDRSFIASLPAYFKMASAIVDPGDAMLLRRDVSARLVETEGIYAVVHVRSNPPQTAHRHRATR